MDHLRNYHSQIKSLGNEENYFQMIKFCQVNLSNTTMLTQWRIKTTKVKNLCLTLKSYKLQIINKIQ